MAPGLGLLLPLLLGLPRRRPAAGPAGADNPVAAVAALRLRPLDMLTASGREEHR
jgi:hypothetical protein